MGTSARDWLVRQQEAETPAAVGLRRWLDVAVALGLQFRDARNALDGRSASFPSARVFAGPMSTRSSGGIGNLSEATRHRLARALERRRLERL